MHIKSHELFGFEPVGNSVLNGIKPSSEPLAEYHLSAEELKLITPVVIKSNLIVLMEKFSKVDPASSGIEIDENRLEGEDVPLLITAFLMAQCLRETKRSFDANTRFNIWPLEFFKLWGGSGDLSREDKGNLYRACSRSASRLNNRKFIYPSVAKDSMVESGYFSEIDYGKGHMSFYFPPSIIEYIKTDSNFTWYYFENVAKIKTKAGKKRKLAHFAISLYENLQMNKNLALHSAEGKFKVQIKREILRKILGIKDHQYKENAEFHRSVLDKAVDVIHTALGIDIHVNQINRPGVKDVVSYEFLVKVPAIDLNYKNAVRGINSKPILTSTQSQKFAMGLVKLASFKEKYGAGTYGPNEFYERVVTDLLDPYKLVEYEPYLRELNINSKRYESFLLENKEAILKGSTNPKQAELDLGDDMLPF